MSAEGQDSIYTKYEATVITGLEWIAKDEVKEKLDTDAEICQGRILFTSNRPVHEILGLKSISNLFVTLYDEVLDDSKMPRDPESLENLMMDVVEKADWTRGLMKWLEMSKFETELAVIQTKRVDYREIQPKFRVSCNRYGKSHNFTSPEVCSILGHAVDTKYGWPIKMKDFDLEIMSNFNENHLQVGITLSQMTLDRRNITSPGFTTLRAATCYALLRLAKIRPGDIVVDPMAGSGAIPVECCSLWQTEWLAFSIASELKFTPLEKAKANLANFRTAPWDMMVADVTSMPFRSNSIDVFVSDLPFGKRHGSKKRNKTLYPALLAEMGRVSRIGSGRAVLLTQDFKSMNYAYDKNQNFWFQKLCSFVKIGNLNCYIYLFVRKNINKMKVLA